MEILTKAKSETDLAPFTRPYFVRSFALCLSFCLDKAERGHNIRRNLNLSNVT